MEAKKWLQEKKSGLDTNSDIGYGSPSLNLVALPQVIDFLSGKTYIDVCTCYLLSPFSWYISYNFALIACFYLYTGPYAGSQRWWITGGCG